MKNYIKIFMEFYGYTADDVIPCGICNEPSADVHHIEARGMGGSKNKDYIENLIPLCRLHHHRYGDIPSQKEYLKEIVRAMVEARRLELEQEKIH